MKVIVCFLLAVLAAQCFALDTKARLHDLKAAANVAVKAGVKTEAKSKDDPATALTSSSCGGNPCAVIGDSYNSYDSNGDAPLPDAGNIMDALRPIEDWIATMKRRVGAGGDLYNAAEATVRPLIEKLKRVQKATEEKIEQSNDAIIQHVEEATTNHIYNLLRATHELEKQQQKKEEVTEQKKEFEREEKERKALQEAVSTDTSGASSASQASS